MITEMTISAVFYNKFNNDTHNVVLSNEDDLYGYAHSKFMQYAEEIEQEYGINSDEMEDGAEWYDDYQDMTILDFCSMLKK